ncbi:MULTISPECIES: phosphotransferase [unclassified Synechocystis]|uniref:phosphotransferase n=1 Tax=unclassified Synechocystis TaxID=2640012 RepID=UPI0004916737|nr:MULTISPECIES: phosphotransferase enzyme family protein [unclassified Synechocystis]AIE73412.2 Homoserine kinase [Synechocystis sp. PCC 6714]MCT0254228.1 phosphotransferase enzyme family protein [Synechocystis sp. CS-94]
MPPLQLLRSLSALPDINPVVDFPAPNPAPKSTVGGDAFPSVYSTLAPHALTNLVFKHYDIEVPKGCRFWHRGLSDVYLVETLADDYILRISHQHWRTESEIQFELDLLNFLADRDVPVAAPLRHRDGGYALEINAPEGKRYASLFPYAPGGVAIGDLNKTQGFLLGEMLAQLHQTAQRFKPSAHRPPLTLSYLLDDSLHVIAPFLHHRLEEWRCLIDISMAIKTQLKTIPTHVPYWTICWGDPHSGNVHFTAEDQMMLFDFDQCGMGWRAFDIAKFLQVSMQSGLGRNIRDAFLSGYNSIAPLTVLEENCLQALTQTAFIWSWAIHVQTLKLSDYSRLHSGYFKRRLETLQQLGSTDWQLF